jgi:hypothetical protein
MSRFSDLYTPKEVEKVEEVKTSIPAPTPKLETNQKNKTSTKGKI